MNPWIETLGAILLAAFGAVLGWWFSRRPKPWGTSGYFLPLTRDAFAKKWRQAGVVLRKAPGRRRHFSPPANGGASLPGPDPSVHWPAPSGADYDPFSFSICLRAGLTVVCAP
jgi:hypothetical protein